MYRQTDHYLAIKKKCIINEAAKLKKDRKDNPIGQRKYVSGRKLNPLKYNVKN